MKGGVNMECPYLDQNNTKAILTGFAGGSYSGAYICIAQNKAKLTNQYVGQVCQQNDATNCKQCNFHPVKHN